MHINSFLRLLPVILLFASVASADGGFVHHHGAPGFIVRPVHEPQQKALLGFKDGKEILVLQVKFSGQAEDFGWLIPTPDEPTVNSIKEEADPFDELNLFTQIRPQENSGVKDNNLFRAAGSGMGNVNVEVLQRKIVGIFDVAVLKAGSGSSLAQWLTRNGFETSSSNQAVLDSYINAHWCFTAVKVHTTGALSGELPPLDLTFNADKPVFPMRISSVNPGVTDVLLYVAGEVPWLPKPQGHLPPFFEVYSVTKNQSGPFASAGVFPPAQKRRLPLTLAALEPLGLSKIFLQEYRTLVLQEELDADLYFEAHPQGEILSRAQTENANEQLTTVKLPSGPFVEPSAQEDVYQFQLLQQLAEMTLKPDWLARMARAKDYSLRVAAAAHPYFPSDLLGTLAQDGDHTVRETVASNARTSPSTLKLLATDPSAGVRKAAAKNPNTPHDLLETLSRDSDTETRTGAIGNPSFPTEKFWQTVEGLSDDNIFQMLGHGPAAAAVPGAILDRLARSNNEWLRSQIASREDLPASTVALLMQDPSQGVRSALANNAGIPLAKRKTLVDNVVIKIEDEGKKPTKRDTSPSSNRLVSKQDLLKSGLQQRVALAGHPVLDPETGEDLALDKEAAVRERIASRPGLALATLQRLAVDPVDSVRIAVIRNLLPWDLLLLLTNDKSPNVALSARQRVREAEVQFGALKGL